MSDGFPRLTVSNNWLWKTKLVYPECQFESSLAAQRIVNLDRTSHYLPSESILYFSKTIIRLLMYEILVIFGQEPEGENTPPISWPRREAC